MACLISDISDSILNVQHKEQRVKEEVENVKQERRFAHLKQHKLGHSPDEIQIQECVKEMEEPRLPLFHWYRAEGLQSVEFEKHKIA